MSKLTLDDLSPVERRIFDVIADVDEQWSVKRRSEEKAGAKVAIGAILHRLGWTGLGLDESERRAKGRMRGARNR